MIFIGLVILGGIVAFTLPVSLLPEIPIPQISVQVNHGNASARELENNVVAPLRQQLLQVAHLKDIRSHTRNGQAVIQLDFEFGTDTDYAFMEANEKIDHIMSSLPRDMERPRVVKANADDIPVLYLSMTAKEGSPQNMLEISQFAQKIIRRRIEQLPEVAFVDISGLAEEEVVITPDPAVFRSLGLTEADIEAALHDNSVNLGSYLIQDGHYQYSIRFLATLQSLSDVAGIRVRTQGRSFRLGDIAKVESRPRAPRGGYLYNGREAIVFSIRKKSGSRLFQLKSTFKTLLSSFEKDYPDLDFKTSNDQSKILEISINNLQTSLLYGAFFAFLIMFLFFRTWKAPLLIGLAIPVSLMLSLLGFYLLDISLNVISISGLILGVGLMIDNSIIIIENIQQLENESEVGTPALVAANEVIRPLISSSLTTCSVFLPLVFLGGVSGALFYDQALSITIALFASLLVAYFLLPTLLNTFRKKQKDKTKQSKMNEFYSFTVDIVLNYRWVFLLLSICVLGAVYPLWQSLGKQAFPQLTKQGVVLDIDWNEPLSIRESEVRIQGMLSSFKEDIGDSNAFLGEQQFLLQKKQNTVNEVVLWLDAKNDIGSLSKKLQDYMNDRYPFASVRLSESKSLFDEVFGQDAPPLTVRLQALEGTEAPDPTAADFLYRFCENKNIEASQIPMNEQLFIQIKMKEILLHDVPYQRLQDKLRSLFNQHHIGDLQTSAQAIPVVIGTESGDFMPKLRATNVLNREGKEIPLTALCSISKEQRPKTIIGTKSGEILEINLGEYSPGMEKEIKRLSEENQVGVLFAGQVFKDNEQLRKLAIIIPISVILLYLILAAQFESLLLPFIVIFTVPFGALGALGLLGLVGQSLNLVALIGIIVMAGIVVNDAILKVDMMKRLSSKHPLREAIHLAGHRRLKPIIMTSLTTILALLPVLFSSGLGAELQRPLAYAVIGGLGAGTLAGLYVVPLLYALFPKSKVEEGSENHKRSTPSH